MKDCSVRVPLPIDAAITRVVETGWLYTRGSESVRLVREENSKGCRLSLHGPGTEVVTHEFADVTKCMKRQAEIEQNLAAGGYQLVRSSADRRSKQDISQRLNRRRDDSNRRSVRSA